jgi:serine protease Do
MKHALMTMCLLASVVSGAPAQSPLSLRNPLVGPEGRVIGRGAIGVIFDTAEDPTTARVSGGRVTLSSVVAGGPADQAGLKAGDTITTVDGRQVSNRAELFAEFASWRPGAKAVIGFLRDGKQQETTVTVAGAGKLFPVRTSGDDKGMNDFFDRVFGGSGSLSDSGDGEASLPRQSRFGVTVRNLTPELSDRLGMPPGKGVIVQDVISGSFAADINLQRGDVILEVNRQPTNNAEDFAKVELGFKSGQDVVFLLRPRGSSAQDGTVFQAGTLP